MYAGGALAGKEMENAGSTFSIEWKNVLVARSFYPERSERGLFVLRYLPL